LGLDGEGLDASGGRLRLARLEKGAEGYENGRLNPESSSPASNMGGSMKKTDKNGRGRLVSHVYEVLKRKVITLELRPGEFLHEKRLMEELKVGRTPLRESILRLKVEGLVE